MRALAGEEDVVGWIETDRRASGHWWARSQFFVELLHARASKRWELEFTLRDIYYGSGITGVVGEMHGEGDGAAGVRKGSVSRSACCCARTLDDRCTFIETDVRVTGRYARDGGWVGVWVCLGGNEVIC